MPTTGTRSWIAAAIMGVALALSAVCPSAHAQDWPTRTVKFLLPIGAGSGADVGARLIAERLSARWGQPVVIENRPGGDGFVALTAFTNAHDDHLLLYAPATTFAGHPFFYKKLPYDPAKDFTPVAMTSSVAFALAVNPSLPVHSIKELIQYVKERPGQLSFGSTGIGATPHLAFEILMREAGLKMTHVPYRGGGPAFQDVIAGRIDYFCSLAAAAMGALESEQIKPIALLTGERSALFPALKTAKELGFPGVDSYFWTAFFFPKDTPDEIVQKLYEATNRTLNSPVTVERLKKSGVTPIAAELRTPAYLKTFVGTEIANWAAQVKASGVAIE